MLSNIRIVLVNTSHPGNIGATARAMKTMCLDRLFLVTPKVYPSAEASLLASGADDILARTTLCVTLSEALLGCTTVFGASARSRTLRWPEVSPRECARLAMTELANAEVAIVFGPERTGLTNAALEHCQYMLRIPANPQYSSLNLAAAVQIVAYELMLASQRLPIRHVPNKDEPPARYEEMRRFYHHLWDALVDIGFLNPDNPRHLMRRLQRYFNRSKPSETELQILRGILSAAQGSKRLKSDSSFSKSD